MSEPRQTGDRDHCVFCESAIVLADDGAWEDSSGACGCGDGEHLPHGESPFLEAIHDSLYYDARSER